MTSAGPSLPPPRTAGLVPGAAGPRGRGALPGSGPDLPAEAAPATRDGEGAPASALLPASVGPSQEGHKTRPHTTTTKGGSSIYLATCKNFNARIFEAEVLISNNLSH